MADKTVVVRIVVRANQFSSGLKGAAADTAGFAASVERSSAKAGSSALAMGAASATAGKLILVGIGGAMAVSAKAAIDFESSLASVAKTTDLAGSAFARNGSPLAAFGDALRSLSMRIPMNVNELAEIAAMGGQLGIEVPNLIAFTEVMAALGVSTNLGATEAATSLARFSNIMGTAHDQFGRLGSVIVDLGNNFATTEAEIMTFGLRLAPIGRTVGMTEEEVLGLSAALTSLGIPAERGGTALQRLFLDMQSAVQSGGENLEKFADAAHMTTDQFTKLFAASPADAFVAFVKGLKGIMDAGGSANGVLRDLGVLQQRSIQVLLATANGWEVVEDAISTANQAGAEGNALFVEAGRRYGTSASQIQILSNAFTDLRIEVGNALLGSGGLAAGLDFLREFFRIIKDNLPMLGNLVKVLAAVAALRIGANMLEGISTGIAKFKAMKVGVDGATRSMAAMRLASLGLNTAVFAGIAIVGLLITKWAAAAAKAAELKKAARELMEQFEAGVDPVDALVTSFRDQGIFSSDTETLINDLGLSVETFTKRILDGDDAMAQLLERDVDTFFTDFMAAFDMTREEVLALGPTADDVKRRMTEMTDALEGASEQVDALFETKTDQVSAGLVEAGLGAQYTREQIRLMAEALVKLYNIRTPTDQIVSQALTGEGRRKPGGTGMDPDTRRNQRAMREEIELGWQDTILAMEDGGNKLDDFWDSLDEGVGEFNTTLGESFAEVRDTIMSGFPAWDEYEQATIESLSKVIEAQDLYLEDLRDGLSLQNELVGTTSQAVIDYIEGLDPATKGALARWRETNRSEFDGWLTEVAANLGEAGELTGAYWEYELPTAMAQGFSTMVAGLATQVQALELPGEEGAQAFIDGLMGLMASLPADQQAAFRGYLEDLMQNDAYLDSLGFNVGDPVVDGFIRALAGLGARADAEIARQARIVEGSLTERFGVSSPSKMTMAIGMEVTRGLFVGMEDEFDRQLRATRNPMVNLVSPKPVVNLVNKVQAGSRDIILNYPQHTSDDIIDGVQKASILNGLQREAEVVVGAG